MDHRTVCFRLDLDPAEDAALRRTPALSRQCFEAVAEAGWKAGAANGVTLYRKTYYALRQRHPDLPSQLVISARMKASEALKSAFDRRAKGRKVSCPRSAGRAIRYDARSATIRFAGKDLAQGEGQATLASVAGRIRVGFRIHAHAAGWIARAQGVDSAELTWRHGAWHLEVALGIDFPEAAPSGRTRGLDFGVNRPRGHVRREIPRIPALAPGRGRLLPHASPSSGQRHEVGEASPEGDARPMATVSARLRPGDREARDGRSRAGRRDRDGAAHGHPGPGQGPRAGAAPSAPRLVVRPARDLRLEQVPAARASVTPRSIPGIPASAARPAAPPAGKTAEASPDSTASPAVSGSTPISTPRATSPQDTRPPPA